MPGFMFSDLMILNTILEQNPQIKEIGLPPNYYGK